jgi:hypothetical protein
MLKLIRLNRIFNEPMNVKINPEDPDMKLSELPNNQSIEQRVLTVFHDIDILGNYTDYNWFLLLEHHALVKFIAELNDIWTYRANLPDQVKRDICPNYRDLFRFAVYNNIQMAPVPVLFDIAIRIIEMLVRSGVNQDSKCLGANFVLCALTLVNPEAALALPWLYQSVV